MSQSEKTAEPSPKPRSRKPKTAVVDNTRTTTRNGNPLWKKGESSPNPNGRPKGSRNKLSETFIQALYSSFEKRGIEAIEAVAVEAPVDYLKLIASVIPKQFGIEEGGEDAFLRIWSAISEGKA
jgi:hypothetical protein